MKKFTIDLLPISADDMLARMIESPDIRGIPLYYTRIGQSAIVLWPIPSDESEWNLSFNWGKS